MQDGASIKLISDPWQYTTMNPANKLMLETEMFTDRQLSRALFAADFSSVVSTSTTTVPVDNDTEELKARLSLNIIKPPEDTK